ncbi:MAG TPA: hypothetical protein VJ689_01335 [Gaiellaceae bacterium]|nr:hypothetical protein [Gaiellaceae bacterium]
MWRRSCAWVVAIALAVIGSQAAHWLAYAAVAGGAQRRAHLLADGGHGYLAHAPLVLGLLTALVLLALVSEVRLARTGSASRPAALRSFALLAPAVFVFQEHFERLAHDGSFPWGAVAEPTFVLGLGLQLPFALLAYLAARVLLRVAGSLGRRLSSVSRVSSRATVPTWFAVCAAVGRPALCPLGYGLRGPPLLS